MVKHINIFLVLCIFINGCAGIMPKKSIDADTLRHEYLAFRQFIIDNKPGIDAVLWDKLVEYDQRMMPMITEPSFSIEFYDLIPLALGVYQIFGKDDDLKRLADLARIIYGVKR